MKIVIMTDLEGVSGVINRDDWIFPESRYYEKAKELLTKEVNAAIEGFAEAGADEFFVIDGHGHGAIEVMLLDERALYSRGWAVPHQFGLNGDFDAIAWVGQHAKAGTPQAHIAHTGYQGMIDSRINGISLGEFGHIAALAGQYGYPAIFGAGDKAFALEAKALIPEIHTVWVKEGVAIGRGDECSFEEYAVRNLGAVHIHPVRAREMIRKGAYEAMTDFRQNPDKFKPYIIEPPYVLEEWHRRKGNAPAYKETRRHENDLVLLKAAPPVVETFDQYKVFGNKEK